MWYRAISQVFQIRVGPQRKKVETPMLECRISINVAKYYINLLDGHPVQLHFFLCIYTFILKYRTYRASVNFSVSSLLIFYLVHCSSLLNLHCLLSLSPYLIINCPYQPQISSRFELYKCFYSVTYKFVSRTVYHHSRKVIALFINNLWIDLFTRFISLCNM